MNKYKGKIIEIKTDKAFSLVTVVVKDQYFKSIIIDSPSTLDFLKINHDVEIVFKETEVILALGKQVSISTENQINGVVTLIERSEILSRVSVKTSFGDLNAIITTSSLDLLKLETHCEIIALVKTNEIMLREC